MQMFVNSLEECPRIQVRKGTNAGTVERYREGIESGAVFPPLVVFQERDTERYLVADGHHRLEAVRDLKLDSVEVDLREGDETDALEFALGCNSEHGLPRTTADVQNGVRLLMTNPALESKYRTDQEKADLLRISRRQFARYKATWRESNGGSAEERAAKARSKDSARKKNNGNKGAQGQNVTRVTSDEDGELGASSTSARHSYKGTDALNLEDFETAAELLARFPMSGAEAGRKYLKDVVGFDLERVRDAHQFLTEFLEAAE